MGNCFFSPYTSGSQTLGSQGQELDKKWMHLGNTEQMGPFRERKCYIQMLNC